MNRHRETLKDSSLKENLILKNFSTRFGRRERTISEVHVLRTIAIDDASRGLFGNQ